MANTNGLTSCESILNNLCACVYSARVNDGMDLVFLSRASESLTGLKVDEVLSLEGGWLEVVHPDDAQDVMRRLQSGAENQSPSTIEYRIVRPGGAVIHVRDTAAFRQEDDCLYVDSIVEDITHIRRAEAELERTQMLQRIGKLAAGIAHEINTPIQFIGDNLRFLCDSFENLLILTNEQKQMLDSLPNDVLNSQVRKRFAALEEAADLQFVTEETPLAIGQSLEGVKLVSTIVAAMRDFSHIDERRMARADINKALQSCLIMLRNEVKYVADVSTELDEKLPAVVCCIDELNQVFMNLIINAAHSIAEKVECDGDRGRVSVKTASEGQWVQINISDTGMGIPPEIQERIFEPFFTTKPRDKGTGQGLAMASTVIRRKHKGTIDFETEQGAGTTFVIKLPI